MRLLLLLAKLGHNLIALRLSFLLATLFSEVKTTWVVVVVMRMAQVAC